MANQHGYRTCVACGAEKEKELFYRLVKTSEKIELDLTGKKDGRGAYVCKNATCIKRMFQKKALNRSYHGNVSMQSYEKLMEVFRERGETL